MIEKREGENGLRTLALLGLLLLASGLGVALRLLPYRLGENSEVSSFLWNLTPIYAMLVFGVAQFRRPAFGLFVPLALLIGSDAMLHFTGLAPSSPRDRAMVYATYAVLAGLGLLLRQRPSWLKIVAVGAAGPLGFFVITNFCHWLFFADRQLAAPYGYPLTAAGLAECYWQALPFLRNDLIGSLGMLLGLFAAFAWVERRLPVPARQPAVAA